jgi:hypothetical protein
MVFSRLKPRLTSGGFDRYIQTIQAKANVGVIALHDFMMAV